jgi:hypothetical protein
MPISVVFRPKNYTVENHHQVLDRLSEVGQANPSGRIHHQALAHGATIEMVVDIWDSPEQLQAFAQHLMPILQDVGIEPPQPEIYESVLLDEAAHAV